MFVGILWGCLGFTLGGESWARCSRCEVSTAHVAAEFSGPKHWPQKSHHCPTGCPLNRVRIKAMSSSHGAAGVGAAAAAGAGVQVPDGPWYLDKFQEKPNHRSQDQWKFLEYKGKQYTGSRSITDNGSEGSIPSIGPSPSVLPSWSR